MRHIRKWSYRQMHNYKPVDKISPWTIAVIVGLIIAFLYKQH